LVKSFFYKKNISLNGLTCCHYFCQVEVFHLKQRLQTMEGKSSTPRRP
jgi:hypothetical protein